MADDVSPKRPLPECLTRFLSEPLAQVVPLPAGRPPDRGLHPASGASRARPNRALQIFLLWALGYNVLGFAIIVMLWQSMR